MNQALDSQYPHGLRLNTIASSTGCSPAPDGRDRQAAVEIFSDNLVHGVDGQSCSSCAPILPLTQFGFNR